MTTSSTQTDAQKPIEAARSFLRRFDGPKRILVAISGGSDSTGLLLAFHQLLQETEFASHQLCAVTVDHALRAESAGEAEAVAALCASLSIAHQTKLWAGVKPKTGLSDASRQARYRLLCEAARDFDADLILLGHTAGDQRETIAMRKARSAETDAIGLAGMAEATLINREIWACRPFLSIERDDIRAYLTSRQQVWIDDPSNNSHKYERVRVREQLRHSTAEPSLEASARRFALSQQAAIFVEQAVHLHPNMLVSIERSACLDDLAACQYALSYLAAIIGGQDYPLARQQLAPVVEQIASGQSGRFSAHRCLFDCRKSHIYLYREHRNLPDVDVTISEATLWDNRLWLYPQADDALARRVSDAPLSLLRAAAASLPRAAVSDDAGGDHFSPTYGIEAILRPFDQFLPLFDYALAQAIAQQFALSPFPAPPLGGFHSLGD